MQTATYKGEKVRVLVKSTKNCRVVWDSSPEVPSPKGFLVPTIELIFDPVETNFKPSKSRLPKARMEIFITPHMNGKGDGPFVRLTGLHGEGADVIENICRQVKPDFHDLPIVPVPCALIHQLNDALKADPRLDVQMMEDDLWEGQGYLKIYVSYK